MLRSYIGLLVEVHCLVSVILLVLSQRRRKSYRPPSFPGRRLWHRSTGTWLPSAWTIIGLSWMRTVTGLLDVLALALLAMVMIVIVMMAVVMVVMMTVMFATSG